jgi:hypothetical protein
MKSIRQGDTMLLAVQALPKDVKEIPPENGRVVIAYGEVTGHAHAFYETEKVKLWSANTERFLQVISNPKKVEAWKVKNCAGQYQYVAGYTDPQALIEEGWTITALEAVDGVVDCHEEHFHPVISPGIYRLPNQMEYSPKELKKVSD